MIEEFGGILGTVFVGNDRDFVTQLIQASGNLGQGAPGLQSETVFGHPLSDQANGFIAQFR